MSDEFNSMDGEVTSYEIPTALTPQTKNYIDQAAIENETINADGENEKKTYVVLMDYYDDEISIKKGDVFKGVVVGNILKTQKHNKNILIPVMTTKGVKLIEEKIQKKSSEKKVFGVDEKHFFPTMIVVAALTFIGYNIAKKQGWLN